MAPSLFRQVVWAVVAPLGLWIAFIGLSTAPYLQRSFLYAHRVFPYWQDPNKPQKWGFAKNQVTPFSLTTPDGTTIYTWHILPLVTYSKHEATLTAQPAGFIPSFTSSPAFKILRDDPEARLVISFHGNAGHLPNAVRSPHFHTLTDTTSYHLMSIDYRGFGKSAGSPTEEGLIEDATTLIDFALNDAGVAPERIVILGHSLGSAVASAVAERYAQKGVDFAGVVLVSAFSSLPDMLAGYSIAGWIPVLRPLKVWPRILKWVMGFVVDKWLSAERLAEMARVVLERGGHLRLSLVHAADDWDISAEEDDKIFRAVGRELLGDVDDETFAEMKDQRTVGLGKDAFITEWKERGVTVRQELFPFGGHNNIMIYSPLAMEVMRSFESVGADQEELLV